jgi:2,4-dienoyl-CoA reductase-like NADH-dependent reductase (Old Yellow Enzyme family)
MNSITLFTTLELGSVSLRNRIVMAPTTRMRAKMPGNIKRLHGLSVPQRPNPYVCPAGR